MLAWAECPGRRRIAEPRHGGLVTARCARGRRSGGLAGDLRRGGSAVRCRARTRSRALVARRGGAGRPDPRRERWRGPAQLPRPWLFRPVGRPALDVPGPAQGAKQGAAQAQAVDAARCRVSRLPGPDGRRCAQPHSASLVSGWSSAKRASGWSRRHVPAGGRVARRLSVRMAIFLMLARGACGIIWPAESLAIGGEPNRRLRVV